MLKLIHCNVPCPMQMGVSGPWSPLCLPTIVQSYHLIPRYSESFEHTYWHKEPLDYRPRLSSHQVRVVPRRKILGKEECLPVLSAMG